MQQENRRSFVKKSLATSVSISFAGLIRAHGEECGGGGATTIQTTVQSVATTTGVLTVVSRTNTYWANYTVTCYLEDPTEDDIMREIWETLYGGSGSEDAVEYEPAPESNYASVNWLIDITINDGSVSYVKTGPSTYVLSLNNTTLTITRRIKALIS